eukprot:sb/3467268/
MSLDDFSQEELIAHLNKRCSSDKQFKTNISKIVEENPSNSSFSQQPGSSTDQLVAALRGLSTSNSFNSDPPKFKKGDSFITHCNRYAEFVVVNNISGDRQYALFMQTITDDQFYDRLHSIHVDDEDKLDHNSFLAEIKNNIYGEQQFAFRSSLQDCVQKQGESITDYVYRLRQKAELAYPDSRTHREEISLMVFLKGIRDLVLKRKLNELPDIETFSSAIKQAKRLERVDQLMGSSNGNNSSFNGTDSSTQNTGILRTEVKFEHDSEIPSSSSSYHRNRSDSSYSYRRSPRSRRSRDKYHSGY